MELTKKQKEAILTATKDMDYCTIAHKRTMEHLTNKGLAKYTNRFGYRWGAIIELTEKGIEMQRALANVL